MVLDNSIGLILTFLLKRNKKKKEKKNTWNHLQRIYKKLFDMYSKFLNINVIMNI